MPFGFPVAASGLLATVMLVVAFAQPASASTGNVTDIQHLGGGSYDGLFTVTRDSCEGSPSYYCGWFPTVRIVSGSQPCAAIPSGDCSVGRD